MRRLCVGPRAWARMLYLYTRIVYGMDSLGGVHSVHGCLCLYVRTVRVEWFGMDSLDDAPIVRRPACLGSHAILVPVQYLVWTA